MARVFPVVSRELVRACELPAAALPVAVVRLLPWWKRTQQLEPRGERGGGKPNKKNWSGGGKKSLLSCNLHPLQRNSPGPEFQQGSVSTCYAAPAPTPAAAGIPLHRSLPRHLRGTFGVIRPFSAFESTKKVSRAHRTRTCVCAVMRFEVGALRVGLPTAHVVARVGGNSLPWPGAPTAFGLGFLGQAVPAGDHERLCGIKRPQSAWRQRILRKTSRVVTPTGHK